MEKSSTDKSAVAVSIATVALLLGISVVSLSSPDQLLIVKIVQNGHLGWFLALAGIVLKMKKQPFNRGHIELVVFSTLIIVVTSFFVEALPKDMSPFGPVAFASIFLSFVFYGGMVLLVYGIYQAFTARPSNTPSAA